MNLIPDSAIVMAIGLLVVIWAFLVSMMMSHAEDARLKLLLDLAAEDLQPADSPRQGSSGRIAESGRARALAAIDANAQEKTSLPPFQNAWREVPLMFTMSLRGRGM